VPVVRATGGLVDTITDWNESTAANGTATGFAFSDYSALALAEALGRACQVYGQPETWNRLVQAGMRQDWSWAASARKYVELYQQTASQVRRGVVAGNA
jgi:starch synthase